MLALESAKQQPWEMPKANDRKQLLDLPPDLLDRILGFLDQEALKQLRLTCSWLHNSSIRSATRLNARNVREEDLALLYHRLSTLKQVTHLRICSSSLRSVAPVFTGYSLPALMFPILRELVITIEHSADPPQPFLLSALRMATALTALHLTLPMWSICQKDIDVSELLSSCTGLHALTVRGPADSVLSSAVAAPAAICALTALRRLDLDISFWHGIWLGLEERAVQLPPLLSEIGVLDMNMSAADARVLAGLPHLEKLRLSASSKDSVLAPVLQLGHLVELRVEGSSTAPWLGPGCPLIPALPCLTRLQALELSLCGFLKNGGARLAWGELWAVISCASALTRLELRPQGVWEFRGESLGDYLLLDLLADVTLPRLVTLAAPLATRPSSVVSLWRLLARGMPALRDLSLTFFDPRDYRRAVGCGSGLTRLTSLKTEVIQGQWLDDAILRPGVEATGSAAELRELPFGDWPPAGFAIGNAGLQRACLELCVAHVDRDVRMLADLARKHRLHARVSLDRAWSRMDDLRKQREREQLLEACTYVVWYPCCFSPWAPPTYHTSYLPAARASPTYHTSYLLAARASLGPWQRLLMELRKGDLVLEELPGLLRRLGIPNGAPWTIRLTPRTAEYEREFEEMREMLNRADHKKADEELRGKWFPVRAGSSGLPPDDLNTAHCSSQRPCKKLRMAPHIGEGTV